MLVSVLSLRGWPGRDRPLPAVRGVRTRGPGDRRERGALQLHGPLPAENQHHPGLPRGRAAGQGLLAKRGEAVMHTRLVLMIMH